MRLLVAAIVLLVGIVLLIGFAPVADDLATVIAGMDGVTALETALFAFWKYIMAALVFVAVLVVLIKPDVISSITDIFSRKDK